MHFFLPFYTPWNSLQSRLTDSYASLYSLFDEVNYLLDTTLNLNLQSLNDS